MRPIARIRKQVFKLPQREFAVLAGVTQGTVSRWEVAELHPSLEQLGRIRAEAQTRGLAWNDSWFFAPSSPSATSASNDARPQGGVS